MHSSLPFAFPSTGAGPAVDDRLQPLPVDTASTVPSAPQQVPRVIDELYMDPSDHAEPVWALPAHAKTPADLYRDAYPDKSLQGMGVWQYLFSLVQRRYYPKRKIFILCLTFFVLLTAGLTFLFDGDTPLAARQGDNTDKRHWRIRRYLFLL